MALRPVRYASLHWDEPNVSYKLKGENRNEKQISKKRVMRGRKPKRLKEISVVGDRLRDRERDRE
ncbi:hypothetical protein E2C01_007704 [Portunus trituberculatus]|uniref:Uncharacterized protein n=1 Tax=Portunus trituberculatus TaxID=210409 RepID=A0A5B7D0U0_PORTR|nr:hypothetical protein [Portunus trituberculatus]